MQVRDAAPANKRVSRDDVRAASASRRGTSSPRLRDCRAVNSPAGGRKLLAYIIARGERAEERGRAAELTGTELTACD